MKYLCLALILTVSLGAHAEAPPPGMVKVQGGVYKRFYKEKDQEGLVTMSPFFVDKFPVTNKDFLEFVKKYPSWKKSAAPRVFASAGYLGKWSEDLSFPSKMGNQPVVFVSWFAAKKYCEDQGKRLLTVEEWEYASDSSAPASNEKILAWYSRPNSALGNIGQGKANKFGIHDMHGLTWEWVEDFSAVIIKADSRSDNDRDRNLFCGSGALGSTSPEEYTTFMRFAFRSSLKGNYVTENLGFRCGKDLRK